MTPIKPKFGLVLAGGGAKGAYQAGALQYIKEIKLSPHIIAGTSIGALNGAVLASSPTFSEGVDRVNDLWRKLGKANILCLNVGTGARIASYIAESAFPTFSDWILAFLEEAEIVERADCIFDPRPIEAFLREAVIPSQLKHGIELWVTVFPALQIPGIDYDILTSVLDLFRAQMGVKAHWLRVQDCDDDEALYDLLLASAAIPFAFPKRVIKEQSYVDGGLADNVPLGALATRGVTHAIVIHLENGSVWNRHNFPDQTVIEIRPTNLIDKINSPVIGGLDAVLDFSYERICLLQERGYQDAKHYLAPIMRTLRVTEEQRLTQASLICNTEKLFNDEPLL